MPDKKPVLVDEAKEPVGMLLWQRLPWLAVGLVGAAAASVLVSKFEAQLSQTVALAFFIPAIVYLADAVGTQTETIYVRNAARKQISFLHYLAKELLLGLSLGLFFGTVIGIFAGLWQGPVVGFIVSSATFLTVMIAPVVALTLSHALKKQHTDPALGAGPFATILQDIISILIYFAIAAGVLFRA